MTHALAMTLGWLVLSGSPPAPSVALGSGAKMCEALTVADLKAAGLAPDAKGLSANVPEPTSAYCVYAGKSGATGGIELDLFDAAGDVKGTWETILGEMAPPKPAGLPGTDESVIDLEAVSGGPKFAVLVARRGNLVFSLSLPAGPKAKDQLFSLAKLVLARVKG
ncbi:MAG TPA: hypothetical protein VIG99_17545 [Myxococcaceae bacterium]|jgi:hypothetical protein